MTIDPVELALWRGRIEAQFEGEVRRLETIFAERKEALTVASREIDRRLGQMNEVREQLAAQRGEFATSEKAEELDRRIRVLENRIHGADSSSDLRRYLAPLALTTVFLIIALIQVFR